MTFGGKPFGYVQSSEDGFSFVYDDGYLSNGGDRLLSDESRTVSFPAMLANVLPEGERRWFLEGILRTHNPLDLLSGVRDSQSAFAFSAEDGNYPPQMTASPVPEKAKASMSSGGVLGLPVSIPGRFFTDTRFRVALKNPEAFSGVQDKFCGVLDEYGLRLPEGNERGNAILKPLSGRFPFIPQNEHVFMSLYRELFPDRVPFTCLVDIWGEKHYLVERFDLETPWFEATQMMDIQPENKYRSSLEELVEYMSFQLNDRAFAELVDRLIFAFLTGNGDMHLKNFSLSFSPAGTAELSPAYDFLSTVPYSDSPNPIRTALPLIEGTKCFPDVNTFSGWLCGWEGITSRVPGPEHRIAVIGTHILNRLEPMLNETAGWQKDEGAKFRDAVRDAVMPVCEQAVAMCDRRQEERILVRER